MSSDRLPSYTNPPVVEVLASVQFDPVPLNIAHIGLLRERFKDKLHKLEVKPPINPVVERLGVRAPMNRVQVQVSNEFELPRVWFLSDSGDELIQVQTDRFIRNWRAVPRLGNEYPRYEKHLRPRFIEDYQLFRDFLREDGIAEELQVNQCEITYINHIHPCECWTSHRDICAVFQGWNSDYERLVEMPIEGVNLSFAHVLYDQEEPETFIGRLHVALQSAFLAPDESGRERPVFVLTLTARGRPTKKGVLGFLDAGRSAIVTSFDRMTNPKMHQVWGKRYDS
jgi:uncharacterized protein (TIGR04255 family)